MPHQPIFGGEATAGLALRTWRFVLLAFLLLVRLAAAQPVPFPPNLDGTHPATPAEYMNEVQRRIAMRDALEALWLERQAQLQAQQEHLDRLRNTPPPAQLTQREFEERRAREMGYAAGHVSQTQRAQTAVRGQLNQVYSGLQSDGQYLRGSQDKGLGQTLGPLIGTAGAGFVPVWNRPTLSSAMARSQQLGRLSGLERLSTSIKGMGATRASTLARTRAAAPPEVTPVRWRSEVNTAGNIQLRQGNQVIDLKEPASVRTARGETARNVEGFQRADSLAELHTARSKIDAASAQARFERTRAIDGKALKGLDKQIGQLEKSQTEINKEIKKYNNSNQPKGSALGNLAGSAAKWALLSSGMQVGTSVITQMSQNGWNPKAVDWQSAIRPLRTAEFWGGTAGSFVGSMVASMIPGPAFVKTFAAIGGAAVGWQLGTGNLDRTNWTELGIQTTAATLGTVLGQSLGGGIGGFAGGIAAQLATSWLLDKLRDYFDHGSESYSRPPLPTYTDRVVTPYTNLEQFVKSGRYGNPAAVNRAAWGGMTGMPSPRDYANADTSTAVELKAELDRTYSQIQILNGSGRADTAQMAQLQQYYAVLDEKLRELRDAEPTGER